MLARKSHAATLPQSKSANIARLLLLPPAYCKVPDGGVNGDDSIISDSDAIQDAVRLSLAVCLRNRPGGTYPP